MVHKYFDKLTCNDLFVKYCDEFMEKNNLTWYENGKNGGTYYMDDASHAPTYLSIPLKASYNIFYNVNLFSKKDYFLWMRIAAPHQVQLVNYLYTMIPPLFHEGLHENLSKIFAPENISYALQEQPAILEEYLQTQPSKKGSLWTTDTYYEHLLKVFQYVDEAKKATILKNFMIANHNCINSQEAQKKMLMFIEQYIDPQYQDTCSVLLDEKLVSSEKTVEFATVSIVLNYTIEIDKNQLIANIKNISSKTQLVKFSNEMVKSFVRLMQHKVVAEELGLLNTMLCSNKNHKKYYISVYHKEKGIASEKFLALLNAFVIFYKNYYDPEKIIVAISTNKDVLLKWYSHYSLQQQLPVNDVKKGVVKI